MVVVSTNEQTREGTVRQARGKMTRLALTNAGLRHNEIELAISENLDLKNWNNNESGINE